MRSTARDGQLARRLLYPGATDTAVLILWAGPIPRKIRNMDVGREATMRHDQFDPLNFNNQNASGSTLNRFLAGAVAGAAVALLFAPRNGQEARTWLKDGSRRLKDGAGDRFTSVKDMLHDGAEVVKESVAAGKTAYRRAREDSAASRGV